MSFTIAVDGPAGAGKGTISRLLANHLGLRYLDTGKIYRLFGLRAEAIPLASIDAALTDEFIKGLREEDLANRLLETEVAGRAAARISGLPVVRDAVLSFQRQFAHQPKGAVLDGRDIGTVVLPHANVKLFITASPETRARRRLIEELARGHDAGFDEVLANIRERDRSDESRPLAPLRAADDAHLLDTSGMDIETAFRAALAIVEKARK